MMLKNTSMSKIDTSLLSSYEGNSGNLFDMLLYFGYGSETELDFIHIDSELPTSGKLKLAFDLFIIDAEDFNKLCNIDDINNIKGDFKNVVIDVKNKIELSLNESLFEYKRFDDCYTMFLVFKPNYIFALSKLIESYIHILISRLMEIYDFKNVFNNINDDYQLKILISTLTSVFIKAYDLCDDLDYVTSLANYSYDFFINDMNQLALRLKLNFVNSKFSKNSLFNIIIDKTYAINKGDMNYAK